MPNFNQQFINNHKDLAAEYVKTKPPLLQAVQEIQAAEKRYDEATDEMMRDVADVEVKRLNEELDRKVPPFRDEAIKNDLNGLAKYSLDNMFEPDMTPQELTAYIQRRIPTYHFDCGEQHLKEQNELHEAAKAAVTEYCTDILRPDSLYHTGQKVFSGRSKGELGYFIEKFMGDEQKTELKRLADEADEINALDKSKLKSPQEAERIKAHKAAASELHANVCRKLIEMTTDEQLDKYKHMSMQELLADKSTFALFSACGSLNDSKESIANNLSPAETALFHERMLKLQSVYGSVSMKVNALATPLGKMLDVEQLKSITPEQLALLTDGAEEPPYMKNVNHLIASDPIKDLSFGRGTAFSAATDIMADKFPQFKRQFNTVASENARYAYGFDDRFVFWDTDGNELKTEQKAADETLQWKRPVYVTTANNPEADPVLMYIDEKGDPHFDDDAAAAFGEAKESEISPYPNPPAPEDQPGFFGKLWNGLLRGVETVFAFAGADGDSLRSEKLLKYNQYLDAKEMYDKHRSGIEKQQAKNANLRKSKNAFDKAKDKITGKMAEKFGFEVKPKEAKAAEQAQKVETATREKAADTRQKLIQAKADKVLGYVHKTLNDPYDDMFLKEVKGVIGKDTKEATAISTELLKCSHEQLNQLYMEYGQNSDSEGYTLENALTKFATDKGEQERVNERIADRLETRAEAGMHIN